MARDIFSGDITERYGATLRAGLGNLPKMSSIEDAYMESAAQGPDETVAGLALNFDEARVQNVAGLLASGDYTAAKQSYDNMRDEVKTNWDGLVRMSRLDERVGPNAAMLGKRAKAIVAGAYNQEEVTLPDGTKITLGQAFGEGSNFLADRTDFDHLAAFGKASKELYLSGDATAKAIMDPLIGQGKGGASLPNRLQLTDLADDYANNKALVDDVFGDGAHRFVTGVMESHASSGCASETFRTLLGFAQDYSRKTGTSGKQLASDVLNGYFGALGSTFRGDPKTDAKGVRVKQEISDDQRRLFDAMFLPTITSTMKGVGDGQPFNLNDPRLRQGLLEVADISAWMEASGVNLMALARDENYDINDAFGRYIRDGMLGVTRNTDNLVEGFRRARADLTGRIVGADTATQAAVCLTGQPADYAASIARANGGASLNAAADVMATDVQRFILKRISVDMARGTSYQDALASLARTGGTDELAEVLSQSLAGNDKGLAAKALARKVVSEFANGRRVNIQDAIAELAMGGESASLPPRSRTVLMRWYQGNVPGPLQFGDERSALMESLLADNLSDAQARRTVSAASAMAATFATAGRNPRDVFKSARGVGTMYVPVDREVQVPDGKGGVKTVVRTEIEEMVGNRDKASYRFGGVDVGNGTFTGQPDLWYQTQRVLKEMRDRQRAQEADETRYRRHLEIKEEYEGS